MVIFKRDLPEATFDQFIKSQHEVLGFMTTTPPRAAKVASIDSRRSYWLYLNNSSKSSIQLLSALGNFLLHPIHALIQIFKLRINR